MTQGCDRAICEYPLCTQRNSQGRSWAEMVSMRTHGNRSAPQASDVAAGQIASFRLRSMGVRMDRLSRRFLNRFIRRGSMTVTTASGTKFTCGDGTGQPVAVRFVTGDAERKILVNPELGLGEAFMDGEFVVETGTIADALAILLDQPDMLPHWAKPSWRLRYLTR